MVTMDRVLKHLQWIFLGLFVLRSVTDVFQDPVMYIASTQLTLSAIFMILIIAVAITYLSILFVTKQLILDTMAWIFLAWVLSLAPWVYLAAFNFGGAGLTGVREWIRLLSILLFFVTITEIAKKRGHVAIINATLLSLSIPLAVSYYQIIFKMWGEDASLNRTLGTMSHSSTFAFAIVVMIGLTIWKYTQARGKMKTIWGIALVAEIPPLITSSVLGGWIMGFVLLIVAALLSESRKVRKRLRILTTLLVVFVIVGSFAFPDVRLQFEELWKLEGNPVGRLEKWDIYLDTWQQQPILGYGLNTSLFVWPFRNYHADRRVTQPHNDYLRYLTECGVFGLLAFVGFLVLGLRKLIGLRRRAKLKSGQKDMVAITIGLFIGWMVVSIADNAIIMTVFQLFLWSTIAATVSWINYDDSQLLMLN